MSGPQGPQAMMSAAVLGSADFFTSDSECGAPSVLLFFSVTVVPDLTLRSPGSKRCPSWMYALILTFSSPRVSIVSGLGFGFVAADAGPMASADTPSAATAASAAG